MIVEIVEQSGKVVSHLYTDDPVFVAALSAGSWLRAEPATVSRQVRRQQRIYRVKSHSRRVWKQYRPRVRHLR